MRAAMVFAASLLGSSIMIFLPLSQDCSSSAKGSSVLFPAPGGALTISVFCCANCSRTCAIISVTGRFMEKGSKGNDVWIKLRKVNLGKVNPHLLLCRQFFASFICLMIKYFLKFARPG